MNKSLKYLLFTALAVSVASVSATKYTEHTYLSRRPVNVNLPMELTTFNERMQACLEKRFGGNFQVSGFYGQTKDGDDIGAYFGINDKSTYQLTQPYAAANTSSDAQDFDLSYIIHDYLNQEQGSETSISLNPKSIQYGARFDYYQNMDKLLKGLYLKINTTVVHVENNMNLDVDTTQGGDENGGIDAATLQGWLEGFFDGTWDWTSEAHPENTDLQAKLDHGLMSGKHSKTGFADVDVILGYKFIEKAKYHAGINFGFTIPTGNNPRGVELFEPVYGNHKHWGVGGGLDAHMNLWTKDEQDLKLNFVVNYRYLLKGSEHRPLGLKNYASPYVLLGKYSTDGGIELVPAVNVLTRLGVEVTPRSQFDGILALAYNNGGFSLDLGYNLYARSAEKVALRGEIEEDTWGVAARDFDTAGAFDGNPADFDAATANPQWITDDAIDTGSGSAATPSQLTNGIYGGFGYHFKHWEYPLLLGLGGKYDWASKNSEFDSWSVWAKVAISF